MAESRNEDDAIIEAARADFLDEAATLLVQFESSLLGMEGDPGDPELLNAAFRAAHTIKGTAGLFGLDAVVVFTHEVETLLESMRAGNCVASEESIALLLASKDQIESLLEQSLAGTPDPETISHGRTIGAQLRAFLPVAHDSLAADTAQGQAADRQGVGSRAQWAVRAQFGPDALRAGLEPMSFLRYLATLGEISGVRLLADSVPTFESLDPECCYLGFSLEIDTEAARETLIRVFEFAIDDCELSVEPVGPPAGIEADEDDSAASGLSAATLGADDGSGQRSERRGRAPGRRAADEPRYVRVQADKLDALIDLIGELVIASSGAQIIAQRESSADFGEASQRIRGLVEAARDGALALRMVPIGETFARFQRVVRDVSKALGKDVELQITGGDTELDKSMVEVIADPLMHLVRNSLDHGIEPTAERLDAGKPARGRLALNAYHESGIIVIEVSDDGRGLNRERILAKAIASGLVNSDQSLSDHDVHQLICHPGFSTAENITDISGRGVGMDVVKRSIEALRGQMMLASTEGRGTTTQIRLPLTLAIIDGFLCAVDNVHYVVPLEMVSECIETPSECRGDGISGYFDLRGEVLPFLDVRAYLGHGARDGARQSVIVVKSSNGRVGLMVDRLMGEYQTVIKPLGRMFRELRGIGGSTILGSGEVALILDVAALVERVRQNPAGPSQGLALDAPPTQQRNWGASK